MLKNKGTLFFMSGIMILLLLFGILLADNTSKHMKNLMNKSKSHKKSGIFELFRIGKAAIPSIVKEISCGNIITNFLSNPSGSIRTNDHLKICSGAYAAYLIEMILAIDWIDKKKFFEDNFLLGSDNNNYIYFDGFIVSDKDKCISRNKNEMIKIANIYKKWWEINKCKSLEQLRDEWKNNIRPLSGSGYQWK